MANQGDGQIEMSIQMNYMKSPLKLAMSPILQFQTVTVTYQVSDWAVYYSLCITYKPVTVNRYFFWTVYLGQNVVFLWI